MKTILCPLDITQYGQRYPEQVIYVLFIYPAQRIFVAGTQPFQQALVIGRQYHFLVPAQSKLQSLQ